MEQGGFNYVIHNISSNLTELPDYSGTYGAFFMCSSKRHEGGSFGADKSLCGELWCPSDADLSEEISRHLRKIAGLKASTLGR